MTAVEAQLAAVRKVAADADRGVEAIETTLAMYQATRQRTGAEPTSVVSAHGVGAVRQIGDADSVVIGHRPPREPEEREPYADVIRDWAAAHDGLVSMRQITKGLTDRGMFKDERTAQGALFPAVRRLVALENANKVSRGVYHLDAINSAAAPAAAQPEEQEEDPWADPVPTQPEPLDRGDGERNGARF